MKTLLATRSKNQNQHIINYFQNTNIKCIDFPLIDIQAAVIGNSQLLLLENLNQFKKIIFISSNAVDHFQKKLLEANISIANIQSQFFCVGPTTQKEFLNFFNFQIDMPENQYDTNGLLNMKALEIIDESEKILIVRGVGGKEILKSKLEERGATVSYLECYKRVLLDIDFNFISKCTKESEKIFILITSNEIARHFLASIKNSGQNFKNLSLIANHNEIFKTLKNQYPNVYLIADINPKNIQDVIENN
jgi:uroporphyrinogen-III synthase